MKSFEAESGAAQAKAAEKKYIEGVGGSQDPDKTVLATLDVPELSLESSSEASRRIQDIRQRTTGSLSELRVSEAELRSQGVEAGANPNPSRTNEVNVSGREYFAKGPDNPLVESDALAEARIKDPARAERVASLKRNIVSRQADIMNLEQQIAGQADATLQLAQKSVLAQFKRELATVQQELDELGKGI